MISNDYVIIFERTNIHIKSVHKLTKIFKPKNKINLHLNFFLVILIGKGKWPLELFGNRK